MHLTEMFWIVPLTSHHCSSKEFSLLNCKEVNKESLMLELVKLLFIILNGCSWVFNGKIVILLRKQANIFYHRKLSVLKISVLLWEKNQTTHVNVSLFLTVLRKIVKITVGSICCWYICMLCLRSCVMFYQKLFSCLSWVSFIKDTHQ